MIPLNVVFPLASQLIFPWAKEPEPSILIWLIIVLVPFEALDKY
jgi:hypothetical protein